MEEVKKCTKCGCIKPLSEFYRDHRVKKDGLQAQCKQCTDNARRKYRASHKKERSEYERNKRLEDPEWREKAATRNKRYLDKLKDEGGTRLEEHKEKVKKKNLEYRQRDLRYMLWHAAKCKALDKGLPFNIELEDIIIPEKCPILNIPICQNRGQAKSNSISLDRIDPSKGYVKGNVAIISRKANVMKNDATREELETFCKNIFNYVDRKDIVQTAENKESTDQEDKEPFG